MIPNNSYEDPRVSGQKFLVKYIQELMINVGTEYSNFFTELLEELVKLPKYFSNVKTNKNHGGMLGETSIVISSKIRYNHGFNQKPF